MDSHVFTDFVHTLNSLPHNPPYSSKLGLVALERDSLENADRVFDLLQYAFPVRKVSYESSKSDMATLEEIVSVLESDSWVFLDLQKDPGSRLNDALMHLQNSSTLRLYNFREQPLFRLEIPEGGGIIVCAERSFIEEQVSATNFYGMFGPVIGV
jgi:hypothetical protein